MVKLNDAGVGKIFENYEHLVEQGSKLLGYRVFLGIFFYYHCLPVQENI